MKKLTDKLSDEVGVAITSNTSISEHFKNVDWNSIYNHTVN